MGRPLPTADVGSPVDQLEGQLSGGEIAHPAVAGRPIPAGGRFRSERPVYTWHLTFDHAAEKVSDRDSGRSQVATIARQRIPAERLHPKATNWRCRPGAEFSDCCRRMTGVSRDEDAGCKIHCLCMH